MAQRAHIPARSAHRLFRMRDELSHQCPLVEHVGFKQVLTIDSVAVAFVVLASAGIAFRM